MAQFIRGMTEIYRYLIDDISDPRVADYPLMGSPWKIILIFAIYLVFVLNWGPKLMEKRKPFDLRRIIILFNAVQVAFCSFMFISAMVVLILMKHNWICQAVDYSPTGYPTYVLNIAYMYFLNKILDLLDTVFFILRKKDNQVTFLHVYHHGGMLLLGWIGVKYLAGGHAVTLGVLNTFVHIAMYTYYLLSSLNSKYKNNIWWKRHITHLQLIQFFILTLHFMVLFFVDCGFPQFIAYFMVPQNVFMFAMFSDFYIKAYVNSNPDDGIKPQNWQQLNGNLDTKSKPPGTTTSGSGEMKKDQESSGEK